MIRDKQASLLQLITICLFAISTQEVIAQGELALSLQDFESVTLIAPDIRAEHVLLPVQILHADWQLELTQNKYLLEALSIEQQQSFLESDDRFYKGTVTGKPYSWVRLSWLNGHWEGGFFDGESIYLIDQAMPLLDALTRVPTTDTILYKLNDLNLPWPVDAGGVDMGYQGVRSTDSKVLNPLTNRFGGTTIQQLLLTIVTDTQFNNIHDTNVGSVVASRINFIDGIYANQVGVSIGLGHLEQLTNNSTLTSTDPEVLLDQFGDFILTGAGNNIPQGGTTHLFTGRNIDGTTVGIAYLGVICSGMFGFGINQDVTNSTTSALIIAHELGHNFDAPHDGEDACISEPFNGIMNPSINGSEQFSNCSLQQMAPELASANCLIETEDTILITGFEINE